MGLREEIIAINYHAFEHAALAKGKTEGDVADEIINKVLDAAVEAVDKELFSDMTRFEPVGKYDMRDFHAGINAGRDAINKLRGE